jgi:hypothetical protein
MKFIKTYIRAGIDVEARHIGKTLGSNPGVEIGYLTGVPQFSSVSARKFRNNASIIPFPFQSFQIPHSFFIPPFDVIQKISGNSSHILPRTTEQSIKIKQMFRRNVSLPSSE